MCVWTRLLLPRLLTLPCRGCQFCLSGRQRPLRGSHPSSTIDFPPLTSCMSYCIFRFYSSMARMTALFRLHMERDSTWIIQVQICVSALSIMHGTWIPLNLPLHGNVYMHFGRTSILLRRFYVDALCFFGIARAWAYFINTFSIDSVMTYRRPVSNHCNGRGEKPFRVFHHRENHVIRALVSFQSRSDLWILERLILCSIRMKNRFLCQYIYMQPRWMHLLPCEHENDDTECHCLKVGRLWHCDAYCIETVIFFRCTSPTPRWKTSNETNVIRGS
jgi:hypothetical protein